MSEKKDLSLLVLKALYTYSSADHPLTSLNLCKILKLEYGRICDPRTLKSTLNTLIKCGYPIKTNEKTLKAERKNNWYLEPALSDEECICLTLALDTSVFIDNASANNLRSKLSTVLSYDLGKKTVGKSLKKHISSDQIIKNLKAIDRAIKEKCAISFSIITHFINNTRQFESKNNTVKIYTVRPIEIICAYGMLLVFCELGDTKMYRYFQIERLYDIEIKGYTLGASDYVTAPLPQNALEAKSLAFSERQRATVRVHNSYLSEFVEQLGQNCELICKYDDKTEIAITTDLRALKHLILSFGSYAEALSPTKLRRSVALELRAACAKYPEVRRLHGAI